MAVKKTPKTAARRAPRAVVKTAAKTTVKPEVKTSAKAGGQAAKRTVPAVVPAIAKAAPAGKGQQPAAFQGYDELAVLGQGNFEALVRSNSVVAKGFEVIGMEVLAFAQRSVEGQLAQARALIGAKDIQEFVALQNDYATKRLEDTLAETAKLTELSTQVANEAMEPLKQRVDATVETVLKAKAA